MTTKLKAKFHEYHINNPQVYDKFEKMALTMARRGRTFGAKAIMEVMRWNTMVSGDDDYKINNSYTAYYSRLFEKNNPEHAGLFRKRSI